MEKKPWYASWFDTSYYHILYKHRDDTEAKQLITSLLNYLNLSPPAHILDLACGKGRHAVVFNREGFEVTGLDLSENNISFANQKYSCEKLHFKVADMRKPFGIGEFDAVFNLFTSFGYFDTDDEHQQSIQSISDSLKHKGYVVFDFMNATKVKANLVTQEHKSIKGIDFYISRKVEDHCIVKDIRVEGPEESFDFQERVRAIGVDDFKRWFEKSNLTFLDILDVPSLTNFNPLTSDRMLVVGQKNI